MRVNTKSKKEAGQYTAEELLEALSFQNSEDWDEIPELSVMVAPLQGRPSGEGG